MHEDKEPVSCFLISLHTFRALNTWIDKQTAYKSQVRARDCPIFKIMTQSAVSTYSGH